MNRIADWFKRSSDKNSEKDGIPSRIYPKTRFATSIFKDSRINTRHSSIGISGPNRDDESIVFTQIDYITAEKYTFGPEEELTDGPYFWVSIKSFTTPQLDASSWMDGFQQLESWLWKLPGFDREVYLDFIEKDTLSVVLWRKDAPDEMIIHPAGSSSADLLQEGIWLDDQSVMIQWGTYKDLIANPLVHEVPDLHPNELFISTKYRINAPFVLNGVKLDYLEYRTDGYVPKEGFNSDLPVVKTNGCMQLGSHPKKAFGKLESHLDTYFQGWEVKKERDHRLSCTYTRDRVSVNISLLYSEDLKDYDGVCWLFINYQPDLTRYYTDTYQQSLQITAAIGYRVFPFSAAIDTNYRLAPGAECYARYTPACFQSLFTADTQFLIWIDPQAGKIGFASPEQAMILNSSDIKGNSLVFLSSYFRDSQPNITLKLNLPTHQTQLIADFGSFKEQDAIAFASEIEEFLEITMIRTEDRQYY